VEVAKWCEERSEGGEAVSTPSGPQEGARDAEGGPGGVKMRFLECSRGCRGPKIGVGSVWRALVRMSARQVAQRREPEAPKGPKVEA